MSTISSGRPRPGLHDRGDVGRARAPVACDPGGGEQHVDAASSSGRSSSGTALAADAVGELAGPLAWCGWPRRRRPPRHRRGRRPCPRPSRRRRAPCTGVPARPPRRSAAMATAACDTEAMLRAMPVSVRARLPASSAWRINRLSVAPEVPSVSGPLPGDLDLALDLALAQHRRVEPGGHRHQVLRGGRVVVDVEVVGEVLGREEREVGEEAADVAVGAVEPLGDGVDLGAVARRQHQGLADVRRAWSGRAGPSGAGRHPRSSARAGRAERCGGSVR